MATEKKNKTEIALAKVAPYARLTDEKHTLERNEIP